MKRSQKLLLTIGFTLAATQAYGQDCPHSLVISESSMTRVDGWSTSPSVSDQPLVGMEIVEGELHEDESENAVLKPQMSSNGDVYWKFRGAIGSGVVWMRCRYKDSSVQLTRRVEALVTECRVKYFASSQRDRRPSVRASCGETGTKPDK